MLLHRSPKSPNEAIDTLTRDLGRIRADLNEVRNALSYRSRTMLYDASGRMSEQANEAARHTSKFVRERPGTSTGIGIGVLALIGAVVYGLMTMKR